MTLSDFSVLLLAWDDADPSVAVLGGAALPPTLPLVYRLAAQQPLLAVYPHLPTDEKSANEPASPTAPVTTLGVGLTTPATAQGAPQTAAPDALTAEMPMPGVRLLPTAAAVHSAQAPSPAQPFSRIIGLDDLPAGSTAQLKDGFEAAQTALGNLPAAAARSQWPNGAAGETGPWQAPAAPYLGASAFVGAVAPAGLAPVPLQSFSPTVREAANLAQAAGRLTPTATEVVVGTSPAGPPSPVSAVASASASGVLPIIQPAVFSEPTEQPGPAEAAAVLAAEDNITLDEVAEEVTVAFAERAAPAAPMAPVSSLLQPNLEDLNFRMIQYARRAAQLVRGRTGFGVIYSPTWPAWLAALEIRNSTGQPLVLYATGLAADFVGPAERGWLLEVERMAMRRARVILVPDEAVRHRLAAHYGGTIGAVRVVAADDEMAVQRVLREVANA